MYWRLIINILLYILSAHLLQSQTNSLGALYRIDELALAYSLFNDVTKVLKVLEKTEKKKKTLVMIIIIDLISVAD